MNDQIWLYIAMGAGVLALAVAIYLYFWVQKQDAGSERAQEVASWIEEGAKSYLQRLYMALTMVAAVMAIILAFVFGMSGGSTLSGIEMAVAFIVGAVCSAMAGYMGMSIAVKANVRTAVAAKESLASAFKVSFYAGTVMGMATVGLAIIGMSLIFPAHRRPRNRPWLQLRRFCPRPAGESRRRHLHQDS